MIRKMFALLVCLMLTLCLMAPAMAEVADAPEVPAPEVTEEAAPAEEPAPAEDAAPAEEAAPVEEAAPAEEAESGWVTIELNNGAQVMVPADYISLTPGMTEEEAKALGLGLTAAYIDQLLQSQGMLLDSIAPDISCEFMVSIQPYEFANFADCNDILLKAAIPTLEQGLGAQGVTIDAYEIMRWDAADGSKDAYIVMEQTQSDPASGVQMKRLHGYSVKNNYGVNVILLIYTEEVTEAQAEVFGAVMASLILP